MTDLQQWLHRCDYFQVRNCFTNPLWTFARQKSASWIHSSPSVKKSEVLIYSFIFTAFTWWKIIKSGSGRHFDYAGLQSFPGHRSPQEPRLTSMRHKPGMGPCALEKRRAGSQTLSSGSRFCQTWTESSPGVSLQNNHWQGAVWEGSEEPPQAAVQLPHHQIRVLVLPTLQSFITCAHLMMKRRHDGASRLKGMTVLMFKHELLTPKISFLNSWKLGEKKNSLERIIVMLAPGQRPWWMIMWIWLSST